MKEARNQVVQMRRFGGPEELEVVDAPLPTAGRGEPPFRCDGDDGALATLGREGGR